MAWELSVSGEVLEIISDRVNAMPRAWLVEVWSEIETSRYGETWDKEWEMIYRDALVSASKIDDQSLADAILEFTEQHRTSSNGGHYAHCCPYGCSAHLVPIEPMETDVD